MSYIGTIRLWYTFEHEFITLDTKSDKIKYVPIISATKLKKHKVQKPKKHKVQNELIPTYFQTRF